LATGTTSRYMNKHLLDGNRSLDTRNHAHHSASHIIIAGQQTRARHRHSNAVCLYVRPGCSLHARVVSSCN